MKIRTFNLCIFFMTVIIFSVDHSEASLANKSFHLTDDGSLIAWVYFKDKGPLELLKNHFPSDLVSARSLKRRLKAKPNEALTDFSDQQIYKSYLAELNPFVNKVRAKSRWLNAVSVETSRDNLEAISRLDFVESIKTVRATLRHDPPQDETELSWNTNLQKTTSLDYGSSFAQVSSINAHMLHEKGFYGEGVMICLLDDGFNLLNMHTTFDSLNVDATWDFIHDDESVDDSGLMATEGWHGTKTLSTIAGYSPGYLIGTAHKATYILGKTEVDASETQVEEDYWVEGIEWADSLGADIVSSSLGYGYYATDPPSDSWYTWEDMNGETAVTTIAAEIAAQKGILIFNSAGNERDNIDHNTLMAPADGFSVLAVAATDANGNHATFSSVGPSADGRVKPDIAAMGSGIVYASTRDVDGFISGGNGTSYSCPIAAGGAALILGAHPGLLPEQIISALRSTASQADSPDKYLGWGVIDVEAAFNYIDTSGFEDFFKNQNPDRLQLSANFPNPFNPYTKFYYRLENAGKVHIDIYDLSGKIVKSYNPQYRDGGQLYSQTVIMDNFSSGVYFYRVIVNELSSARSFYKSGKMILVK